MMKLRFTPRILSFLEGTQAWADARNNRPYDNLDPDAQLMRRLQQTKAKGSDRTRTVEVISSDLSYLNSAIGAMQAGAQDNTSNYGDDGIDARADLAATRAFFKQLRGLT